MPPPDAPTDGRHVWQIPPWQPAALILAATVMLAIDLYASLATLPTVILAIAAVAALGGAVVALRVLMVTDTEGVWVRHVIGTDVVPWSDVAGVDVVTGRRNVTTVRISRIDHSYVDVPPTLLLPTRPTSMPKARRRLDGVAVHLSMLARERRGSGL